MKFFERVACMIILVIWIIMQIQELFHSILPLQVRGRSKNFAASADLAELRSLTASGSYILYCTELY